MSKSIALVLLCGVLISLGTFTLKAYAKAYSGEIKKAVKDIPASIGLGGFNVYAGAPNLKEGDAPTMAELVADLETKATEARQKVDQKHSELDGTIQKIQDDISRLGDTSTETKTSFQEHTEKVAKLEKALDDALEKVDGLHNGGPEEQKGFAQLAAEAEHLKSYRGGEMTLVDYEGSAFQRKALVSSLPGSAGDLVQPYRVPGIITPPERPLTIRSLLPVVRTTSNAIEFARENVFTNNAAIQAAEGDTKAESGITFTEQSTTVKTIAHWIPVSRQILADAPMLQSYIEQRMVYGLELAEETQLLAGSGVGSDILGIIPQATPYDTAPEAGVTAPQNLDRLMLAMCQAAVSLYPVTAAMMNPKDWAMLSLLKDANNQYLFGNPSNMLEPRVWGKRVVDSLSMPAGTFLTGGFSMGATLWDREIVTVRLSEHHENYFTRNLVALLVEERIGLSVERPQAFITGTLL